MPKKLKLFLGVFLIVLLIPVFTACESGLNGEDLPGSDTGDTYQISGQITNEDNEPLASYHGISIKIGDYTITSDDISEDGQWGAVIDSTEDVIPQADNYSFDPDERSNVNSERTDLDFIAIAEGVAEVSNSDELEEALSDYSIKKIILTDNINSQETYEFNRDLSIVGEIFSIAGELIAGTGSDIYVDIQNLELDKLKVDIGNGSIKVKNSNLEESNIESVGGNSFNLEDSTIEGIINNASHARIRFDDNSTATKVTFNETARVNGTKGIETADIKVNGVQFDEEPQNVTDDSKEYKLFYSLTIKVDGLGSIETKVFDSEGDLLDDYYPITTTDIDRLEIVQDEEVQLKAISEDITEFKNWSGDINSDDDEKTLNLNESKEITANFQIREDLIDPEDFFIFEPGHEIKYNLTATNENLDQTMTVSFQSIEEGLPHYGIEFFAQVNVSNDSDSSLGGRYLSSSNSSVEFDHNYDSGIYNFNSGVPSSNYGNLIRLVAVPANFIQEGKSWTLFDINYEITDITNNTVKITFDGTNIDYENYYHNGTGHYILERDIGLTKMEFNPANSNNIIKLEYQYHDNYYKDTISGTIIEDGDPIDGVKIQLGNADWGHRVQTDSYGNFEIDFHGSAITLYIGEQHPDRDNMLDFDTVQRIHIANPDEYIDKDLVINISYDIPRIMPEEFIYSKDYFVTEPGLEIKYTLTDSKDDFNSTMKAIFQNFELDKPTRNLEFMMTAYQPGNTGSTIGGSIFTTRSNSFEFNHGHYGEIYYFNMGSPSANYGNLLRYISIPKNYIYEGKAWTLYDKDYEIIEVDDDQVKIAFNINYEDDDYHLYDRGKGHYILKKDIGIFEIKYNPEDYENREIKLEYSKHQIHSSQNSISGVILRDEDPVENISVQLGNRDWGHRSITDENGQFELTFYGPEATLAIGEETDDHAISHSDAKRIQITETSEDVKIDLNKLSN